MRAANMEVLTEDIQALHPGVVIYGIGDRAHQSSPSGHNEDDTPGSRPEQEDPDDTKPEHRAIDVMLGPSFTVWDGWNLVDRLVNDPTNRGRLLYVIYQRTIWRARNGWVAEAYTGSDPHTNHVHVSGTWQNDEDRRHWQLTVVIIPMEDDEMKFIYANGRGWALVSDRWITVPNQEQANAVATVFGDAKVVSATVYDIVKALVSTVDTQKG